MTLEEMLSGVTPQIVGGEMEWSGDLGKERQEWTGPSVDSQENRV